MLIPIAISIFVYNESSNILENEIDSANKSLLKQVQQNIDSRLKDINMIGTEIAWNSSVRNLMYSKDYSHSVADYNAVIRDLRVYRTSNNFVDAFFVFLKDKGIALTADTAIPANLLYAKLQSYKDLSFKEWDSLLWSKHSKEFIPMTIKKYYGEEVKAVAYTQTLPIDNLNKAFATLMIVIDNSKLLETISNVQWVKDGIVLILDSDNHILSSTAPIELTEQLNYGSLKEESSSKYYKINNKKYMVSYATSEVTKWKYVSIIPDKVFWEKSKYIGNIIIIGILSSILLGGLLTWFFMRRNYNPIKKLVKILASKAGVYSNQGYNEYNYIQEAISNTLGEKEKISETLKQQNYLLKSSFLIKLLKGKLNSKTPINEALSLYEINFYTNSFAVMLFYIEDFSEFFTESNGMEYNEKFKLAQFIIGNVVEELVSQNNLGIMIEVDEMLACLINFKENDLENRNEDLQRIALEAKKFFAEKFQIYFSVSISDIHNSINDISKAYEEAMDTMEYKIVMGTEGIISYRDANFGTINESQCNYYYPLQTEQQLINCIKAGDYVKAKAIFDEVYQTNFKKASMPLPIAKCLMFNLISTIIKTIYEINRLCEGYFLENLKPIERLLGCQTINEMKQQMTDILKHVCEYVEDKRKNDNNEFKNTVINFIEANYKDVNLSLSMIADQIGITPAYLSKLFKEYTGEVLLDYINKVRLLKAKQLLKKQSSNIGDVAVQVGYYNSNALIRAFKKYEGITPGKYKDIN